MQAIPQQQPTPQSTTSAKKENKNNVPHNPRANSSAASQQIQSKYINKLLRVSTKNGRVFYGKLSVLDHLGNLLLVESIGQCAAEVSCPINDSLYNMFDEKLKIDAYINVEGKTEEEKNKMATEFFKNKYYIGAAMVRGDDVVKVEIQEK